jgi:photosystem II oxygen-evolving enhancer protein 2
MLKSCLITLFLVISLLLPGCAPALAEMKTFVDPADGYQLLYPNGWVPADVKGSSLGLDAIFHDLIEPTETLSVIISQVSADKNLEQFGNATEVGEHLVAKMNSSPQNRGSVSLIDAQARSSAGKTYYNLEYQVKFPDRRERHDVASVVINKGKLYTLDISAPERRWKKVKDTFYTVANSFSVY